ncbi:MAG TPA: hypothetical protein VH912_03380 [Streptosporangiaceae bacterium]|jgi:Flp pilus assembly protein TadB
MTTPELPRDDVAAALKARRELGPDYDAAFADSLVERVEQMVQARLNGQLGPRPELDSMVRLKYEQDQARGERKVRTAVAIVSLGVAIPLTGIAAGLHSLAFLVIIWTGIVLINLANAVRRPQ